jgi:cytochrome c nitrite reductase small subunit
MPHSVPKSSVPGPPAEVPAGRSIGRFFSIVPLAVWLGLAGLFGGVVGLGGFTFTYANGFSYLSNDPAACANCHIMRDVYDAWNHSSHKAVAVCNDCHTPHNLVGKYTIKALDGMRHSIAFTLGGFPEPIQIGTFDRNIAWDNCIRCHGDLVSQMLGYPAAAPSGAAPDGGEANLTDCLRCHSSVGHNQ